MSFIFSVNLLQAMEIVILITIKGIQQHRIYIYIYIYIYVCIYMHTRTHKIEEKLLSIKVIYNNKT